MENMNRQQSSDGRSIPSNRSTPSNYDTQPPSRTLAGILGATVVTRDREALLLRDGPRIGRRRKYHSRERAKNGSGSSTERDADGKRTKKRKRKRGPIAAFFSSSNRAISVPAEDTTVLEVTNYEQSRAFDQHRNTPNLAERARGLQEAYRVVNPNFKRFSYIARNTQNARREALLRLSSNVTSRPCVLTENGISFERCRAPQTDFLFFPRACLEQAGPQLHRCATPITALHQSALECSVRKGSQPRNGSFPREDPSSIICALSVSSSQSLFPLPNILAKPPEESYQVLKNDQLSFNDQNRRNFETRTGGQNQQHLYNSEYSPNQVLPSRRQTVEYTNEQSSARPINSQVQQRVDRSSRIPDELSPDRATIQSQQQENYRQNDNSKAPQKVDRFPKTDNLSTRSSRIFKGTREIQGPRGPLVEDYICAKKGDRAAYACVLRRKTESKSEELDEREVSHPETDDEERSVETNYRRWIPASPSQNGHKERAVETNYYRRIPASPPQNDDEERSAETNYHRRIPASPHQNDDKGRSVETNYYRRIPASSPQNDDEERSAETNYHRRIPANPPQTDEERSVETNSYRRIPASPPQSDDEERPVETNYHRRIPASPSLSGDEERSVETNYHGRIPAGTSDMKKRCNARPPIKISQTRLSEKGGNARQSNRGREKWKPPKSGRVVVNIFSTPHGKQQIRYGGSSSSCSSNKSGSHSTPSIQHLPLNNASVLRRRESRLAFADDTPKSGKNLQSPRPRKGILSKKSRSSKGSGGSKKSGVSIMATDSKRSTTPKTSVCSLRSIPSRKAYRHSGGSSSPTRPRCVGSKCSDCALRNSPRRRSICPRKNIDSLDGGSSHTSVDRETVRKNSNSMRESCSEQDPSKVSLTIRCSDCSKIIEGSLKRPDIAWLKSLRRPSRSRSNSGSGTSHTRLSNQGQSRLPEKSRHFEAHDQAKQTPFGKHDRSKSKTQDSSRFSRASSHSVVDRGKKRPSLSNSIVSREDNASTKTNPMEINGSTRSISSASRPTTNDEPVPAPKTESEKLPKAEESVGPQEITKKASSSKVVCKPVIVTCTRLHSSSEVKDFKTTDGSKKESHPELGRNLKEQNFTDSQKTPVLRLEPCSLSSPCLRIRSCLEDSPCRETEACSARNPCLKNIFCINAQPCMKTETCSKRNPCLNVKKCSTIRPCLKINLCSMKSPCGKTTECKKSNPCLRTLKSQQKSQTYLRKTCACSKRDPCLKVARCTKADPCIMIDTCQAQKPCLKETICSRLCPCARLIVCTRKEPCMKTKNCGKKFPCLGVHTCSKLDPCLRLFRCSKKNPCMRASFCLKKCPCLKKTTCTKKKPCLRMDPCSKGVRRDTSKVRGKKSTSLDSVRSSSPLRGTPSNKNTDYRKKLEKKLAGLMASDESLLSRCFKKKPKEKPSKDKKESSVSVKQPNSRSLSKSPARLGNTEGQDTEKNVSKADSSPSVSGSDTEGQDSAKNVSKKDKCSSVSKGNIEGQVSEKSVSKKDSGPVGLKGKNSDVSRKSSKSSVKKKKSGSQNSLTAKTFLKICIGMKPSKSCSSGPKRTRSGSDMLASSSTTCVCSRGATTTDTQNGSSLKSDSEKTPSQDSQELLRKMSDENCVTELTNFSPCSKSCCIGSSASDVSSYSETSGITMTIIKN